MTSVVTVYKVMWGKLRLATIINCQSEIDVWLAAGWTLTKAEAIATGGDSL